jgi:hypothetical protein
MSSDDPLSFEKQRKLFAKRSEEADRARQKICKQFPRVDMLTLDIPRASSSTAVKQSVIPQADKKELEQTGIREIAKSLYNILTTLCFQGLCRFEWACTRDSMYLTPPAANQLVPSLSRTEKVPLVSRSNSLCNPLTLSRRRAFMRRKRRPLRLQGREQLRRHVDDEPSQRTRLDPPPPPSFVCGDAELGRQRLTAAQAK